MRRRHRFITTLIPVLAALYIVMLPVSSLIEEDHGEVLPFFSWRLFTRVPDWYTTEHGLLLHSVDGAAMSEPSYLIPSDDIRHWKALRLAIKACDSGSRCDETVAEILHPIIFDLLGSTNVEFSIVRARVDLHDIQDHIDRIGTQELSKTEFFQVDRMIGRWNTQVGRLDG